MRIIYFALFFFFACSSPPPIQSVLEIEHPSENSLVDTKEPVRGIAKDCPGYFPIVAVKAINEIYYIQPHPLYNGIKFSTTGSFGTEKLGWGEPFEIVLFLIKEGEKNSFPNERELTSSDIPKHNVSVNVRKKSK